MEDVHRTRSLCNYSHWHEDFDISSATLQKNTQIFMVKLDTIWGKIEALGNAKAEGTKREAFLLGIKEALLQVLIQLVTLPGMTYD